MQLNRICLMVLAAIGLISSVSADQGLVPVPTGSQICTTCHVAYEAHKAYLYHRDCTECHTIVDERHLVEGGKNMSFPDAEQCLTCHQSRDIKHKNWVFSEHGRAKLDCRDCHGIHAPKRPRQFNLALWKTDDTSLICVDCHQDVVMRLNMPSHHPVKEGGVSCVSCHDPHAGKNIKLASKNDECYECHQAIRGPKVFEHPPVVEDCTICHNPHGSPNRRLLQIAQPMQCLQCHSLATNTHARSIGGGPGGGDRIINGAQLRNCTTCHGAIHGSHIDANLKY